MSENPYQLMDRPDAPLLGHRQALRLVQQRLDKLHVCVIAPRLFGKTRLLRQAAREAPANGFSQCLVWDLKRHPPGTDDEFHASLCREMERQLKVPREDLVEYFKGLGTQFESIKGVFQELDKAGEKVLVVLDGVEGVLQAGSVTRNVWDNLRDLAELSSVRFVTGSRLPLRQLCPSDSKTSPFWNIFHEKPVRFGAFREDDWPAVLEPFGARRVILDDSARKELVNWTGGIPVLVMAICGGLFESCRDGETFGKAEVDSTAERVLGDYRDHIEMLWHDLPTETRLDLVDLASRHETSRADLSPERIETLVHRGLAVEAGGNRLRGNCRILERYAAQHGQSLPEVKKLFTASEAYYRNIAEVFQLRLAAVRDFDANAEQHVRALLKAMPDPETAKALIRNVADACLELLVEFEFPDGTIDPEWVKEWGSTTNLGNLDGDRQNLQRKVPAFRGPRMRLLSLLHNEATAGRAKSRRSSFLLLQFVSNAANFGQHAKEIGETVPRSFITAVANAAVELLHQVREDTMRAGPPVASRGTPGDSHPV